MKIVYIASSIIPSRSANSVHVMKMCAGLARLGHQVSLLVPDAKNEMEHTDLDVFEFYHVPVNFEIHYLPWLSIKGKGMIFAYLAAKKASDLKPDFIYGRNVSACFFSTKFSKAKVAYESHAPVKSEGPLLNLFFEKMRRQKNFLFVSVISQALKGFYEVNYKISSEDICVLPDGADPVSDQTGEQESEHWVETNKMAVGYIGSFHKGKGLEKLLEIIPLYNEVSYHIVGGKDSQVEEAKKKVIGKSNVFFYGFLPQKEAEKIRQKCDVLLAPYGSKVGSVGSSEISQWMSPLKIFEYMSSGKPIVATDLPVLREVLNESNSILVEDSDINGWVYALKKLADAKLRAKLGTQAKEDFINNYTWDARAKKLIDETRRA
ncbi:glycosyltransferase family 4 protein [Arthrospiribacter ruber]|uniref:Glycosyltransferase n=1 Tax=Arthrospiribacter ruber TaxID=2487934 RepID=A0A951IUI7_9BACT|nr:glycosyltransferase family 4 protein [Arthrospiribacter ruber]MBW3466351.1 glycosyltransferase [Arthrospiribacter ruber]